MKKCKQNNSCKIRKGYKISRIYKRGNNKFSPIRNKGIEMKNPAIAQVLVIAAFFRYFEVLKIETRISFLRQ